MPCSPAGGKKEQESRALRFQGSLWWLWGWGQPPAKPLCGGTGLTMLFRLGSMAVLISQLVKHAACAGRAPCSLSSARGSAVLVAQPPHCHGRNRFWGGQTHMDSDSYGKGSEHSMGRGLRATCCPQHVFGHREGTSALAPWLPGDDAQPLRFQILLFPLSPNKGLSAWVDKADLLRSP